MSPERSDPEGLIAASESATADAPPQGASPARRDRARLIAASIVGGLIVAFAVVNLNDVKVHWLFATGQTPLILVIAVAFLLGVVIDRLAIRARRKRRS